MSNRYLSTSLRRSLEKTIKDARIIAEDGARDAIRRLGVAEAKPPSYLGEREKDLRRRLRAHARALGDPLDKASDEQAIKKLVEATAYAHWHRMLFARFLAERNLLRHPTLNAAVTIEECRELAAEEGLADGWAIAERYAAAMLPAVFRIEDPVLGLDFDPAHTQKLSRLVTTLDAETFQAEDSLGWTYQFWRSAEKEAVNASGVKIGADELPAVTQLFTEPYMVRFLLHNTLGAWWAGKRLAADPKLAQTAVDEDALRTVCSPSNYCFDMLRFVKDEPKDVQLARWRPAAGEYLGWPKDAKSITMLDPCCGSGHFLTEALTILASLRQEEEGLVPAEAVSAVLYENLHGLEIDGRCVQIAAFAVALTAWRIGGWKSLPQPHIAWVGAPPPLPKAEFVALADGDVDLERALAALHDLFAQAPILGSLLKPTGGDLVDPMRIANVEALLGRLVGKTRLAEPEQMEGVVAARGMADAVTLLSRHYTIQATNVPYLGRGKQDPVLAAFIDARYRDARADLATAMIERMRLLAERGGTVCEVTPQSWLFLGSYKRMRASLLSQAELNIICDLGPAAFNDMNWWAARTALIATSEVKARDNGAYLGVSADTGRELARKPDLMRNGPFKIIDQESQRSNPDSRIAVTEAIKGSLLSQYADAYVGFQNGDTPRWVNKFWEHRPEDRSWSLFQLTSDNTAYFDGRHSVLNWAMGDGELARSEQARIQGTEAWGRVGVIIRHMGGLPAGLYQGDLYDQSSAAIIPKDIINLPAIWCYCSSSDFHDNVRAIDQSLKVTNATLVKVPFNLQKWKTLAEECYPEGLPEPFSANPTQWLFHGHPAGGEEGSALHVALARLCGYRWPAESDQKMRLSKEAREWVAKTAKLPTGDSDGLLGIPSVGGELALADRLRSYLSAAFGGAWSDALEGRLISKADEVIDKKLAKEISLEAWLRDRAFRQHCTLFHQRPFIWQIWDGQKEGFSVFVHYHRFDQAALRKLTYTVLGDWLARAKAEKNELRYEKASELQQKLEKILEGEKPYDIFVRWKSLAELPIGWDTDLDDGVRMNIRPFVEAGVLREAPKIKWAKDRGSDVVSAPWYPVFIGERINDHHTSLAEKKAAREQPKKMAGGRT